MNRKFIASMVLKTVALILVLTSLIVNLATLIGGTTTTTSNVVVFLTLIFSWIFYGIDKFFVDKEED